MVVALNEIQLTLELTGAVGGPCMSFCPQWMK